MRSPRERLTLEVMDHQDHTKDRSLGLVEVLASDYIHAAENGEWLVHSDRKLLSEGLRMAGKGTVKGTLNYTVSFYPCLNIADPEEEEEEKKQKEEAEAKEEASQEPGADKDAVDKENEKHATSNKTSDEVAHALEEGEERSDEVETLPKIRMSPEELLKHESGMLIVKFLDGELSHSNCHLEVVMDDMLFPSYRSSRASSRQFKFDEVGDAFVRELEFSQVTLRLMRKEDVKGSDKDDNIIAQLTGNTLDTLKQCLNNPTILSLKDRDGEGGVSKVKISLKYIPVKMHLDPSESINNMGDLRVDVLDATDLPAADRNGYSDPYCKFDLNGKEVFKTKVQKKTLHPAWNEFFQIPVPSRTAASFRVRIFDWDFGESPDFLGGASINLASLEPFVPKELSLTLDGKSGSVRLRVLFKPKYVTRSRQGSSTFSGTFATPGKLVTGVAGAPVKGIGFAAGGVAKGASFIKHGFKRGSKGDNTGSGVVTPEEPPNSDSFVAPSIEGGTSQTGGDSNGSVARPMTAGSPDSPASATATPPHSRSKSLHSLASVAGGRPSVEQGTATITIVSASGYPPSSNLRVHIKQLGTKGAKEVHKSKAIKSPSGQWSWEHEITKVSCSADAQFQVQVKDHSTFGSDDDLGENLFFVDDSGEGSEKPIKAGSGTVVLKTSFASADSGSVRDSPRSNGVRKSFLSKKDRGSTPS